MQVAPQQQSPSLAIPAPFTTTPTGLTPAKSLSWSSLLSSYSAAVDHSPVPIDFLWIANSNFINMSPDFVRVINEVYPAIDFIVTVDPWWTWTAKYSDIVLPACTYWEHWDMIIVPLGGHVQPAGH